MTKKVSDLTGAELFMLLAVSILEAKRLEEQEDDNENAVFGIKGFRAHHVVSKFLGDDPLS